MSSKARRTAKIKIPVWERAWNIRTIGALAGVLLLVVLLLFALTKLRETQVESLPKEFEGRIVDKWASFNETEQGSYPYFRLIVDIEQEHNLTVPVNRDIYERAEVGMRLKRSEKGLEIISDTPTASGGG